MSATIAGLIWIALGLAVLAFGALFVLEGVLYLTRLVAGSAAALTHFVLDGQR